MQTKSISIFCSWVHNLTLAQKFVDYKIEPIPSSQNDYIIKLFDEDQKEIQVTYRNHSGFGLQYHSDTIESSSISDIKNDLYIKDPIKAAKNAARLILRK